MTFDALPAAPAFPGQPLDVRCELQLSGTWTDITAYVHQDPAVVGRGHPDESTTTTASTASATLNNSDGRFSATNPTGPYYGSLIRNVPIRISIPEGASYLRSETDQASYAQCPDSAGVSITGDMDVQVDVTLDNWNAATILAGKWAETGNERTWLLLLNATGTLTFVVSPDGTASASASVISTAMVSRPPLLRMCLRVTYAHSTGVTTFYTAPAGNLASASWTQLGTTVTSGLTSTLFNSTAPVQAGWCTDAAGQTGGTPGMYGKFHALQLLSGIGGTVEASPDFTAQTAGATSFADAQSNTWTVEGTAEISARKYRAHCEVPAWPQTWSPTSSDVKIAISAGGLLRRYGRAQTALHSVMYRSVTLATGTAVSAAYWPCEDAAGAVQFASGLSGGQAMTFTGGPSLAADSTIACSDPLPQVNGSAWYGNVTWSGTWTDNVLRCFLSETAGAVPNQTVLFSMYTTGTIARADLVYGTGGSLILIGYSPAGAQVFNSGAIGFGIDGEQVRLSVNLRADGSDIEYEMEVYSLGAREGFTGGGTVAGTIGAATAIAVNPAGAALGATVIGQLTVQPVWTSLFAIEQNPATDGSVTGPLRAWAGESARNRFARLCSEQGIAFRGRGNLATSAPMGTQTSQTLTALLQECADADRGAWTEPRQVLGFGYRTCADMGNQSAAVVYDYDQDHLESPLEPTEDDQIIVNDITVTNVDGSSARAIQESGSLSVQAPPDGVGDYDTQLQLNLYSDGQLQDEAGWNLLFGTVAEPRYPAINIDLANTALTSLYYATLDADLGDRIQVDNPPAWLPPGLIDQIIQGTTETLFTKVLTEAWAGVPCTPYNVIIIGDATYGRLDTDGSTLATGITSSATSMSAATTNPLSPLWTTSSADWPFSVIMDGEEITVTGVSGTSSPQTLTITRSVNGVVKAHLAGVAIELYPPPILAMTA